MRDWASSAAWSWGTILPAHTVRSEQASARHTLRMGDPGVSLLRFGLNPRPYNTQHNATPFPMVPPDRKHHP